MGINFFSDKAGDAKLKYLARSIERGLPHSDGPEQYHRRGPVGRARSTQDVSPGGLQWGEQYDGGGYNWQLPTGESLTAQSFTFLDMGLGGVWHYNSNSGGSERGGEPEHPGHLGLRVFPRNAPNLHLSGEEQLYAMLVLSGNARFALGEGNTAIVPSFQYRKQGPSSEFMLGAMLRYMLHPYVQGHGHQQGDRHDLPRTGPSHQGCSGDRCVDRVRAHVRCVGSTSTPRPLEGQQRQGSL